MKPGHVVLSFMRDETRIGLRGRATFAISRQIRSAGMAMIKACVPRLVVDVGDCSFMDSTVMGVLAMIALKARKQGLKIELLNVHDKVKSQLAGMGLKRLFALSHAPAPSPEGAAPDAVSVEVPAGEPSLQQTMLDAHLTLGRVDPQNIARFKDVVQYLREERDGPPGA